MAYNVYILHEVRSGSTFLSELLNKTKLFNPVLGEYFLPHYDKNLNSYRIMPNNKFNGDKYFIDGQKLNLSNIRDEYPNMRFIHIYRKDFIGIAVSIFLARKTKIFNIFNNKYRRVFYKFNDFEKMYKDAFGDDYSEINSAHNAFYMLREYQQAIYIKDRYDKEILKYNIEVLKICYEDFMIDSITELKKVFSYLDIPECYMDKIPLNEESIMRNKFPDVYNKARRVLVSAIDIYNKYKDLGMDNQIGD